jgi:hypothetical protein
MTIKISKYISITYIRKKIYFFLILSYFWIKIKGEKKYKRSKNGDLFKNL